MFFRVILPVVGGGILFVVGIISSYVKSISPMFWSTQYFFTKTWPFIGSRATYYLSQTQPYLGISLAGHFILSLGVIAIALTKLHPWVRWFAAVTIGVGVFIKAFGGLLDPNLSHHGKNKPSFPVELRQRINLGLLYVFISFFLGTIVLGLF